MTIPSGDNNFRISSAEEVYPQEQENGSSALQGRVKKLAARVLAQVEEKIPLALTNKKISHKQSSSDHKDSLVKVDQFARQKIHAPSFNEAAIKQKLQNIHTMTPAEERVFIAELSLHTPQLPVEQQHGARHLLKAIQALQNPYVFAMSQEEQEVIIRFSKKTPQLSINKKAYRQAREQVRKEAIQEFKGFLSHYKGSLRDLSQAIEEKLGVLHSAMIPNTLSKILQQKIPKKVGSELTKMVEHLQDFKQGAVRYFENRWDKDLQSLDQRYSGSPSKIMKQLEYISPVQDMQDHVWDTELHDAFFAFMNVPDAAEAESVYAKMYTSSLGSEKGIIEWIAVHARYVKKVYNQSADVHRNMGEGTCLMNSLERHKLLLDNAKLSAELLPLGSSLKGRMEQKRLDEEMKQASQHPEKFEQLHTDLCARMGVKTVQEHYSGTGAEGLKETLEQLNSQGEKIFTLYLRDKVSAAGHAFNIQYDPQAAIFRFVDDNLGVVDCPNAEVFVESLSSWIFQAYSDFQLASLETFKSL